MSVEQQPVLPPVLPPVEQPHEDDAAALQAVFEFANKYQLEKHPCTSGYGHKLLVKYISVKIKI